MLLNTKTTKPQAKQTYLNTRGVQKTDKPKKQAKLSSIFQFGFGLNFLKPKYFSFNFSFGVGLFHLKTDRYIYIYIFM